ncbi:MAG: PepSY-like domain-containing protein [Muribaculaceae bacterium]|nr:PepSY-like domain-containing protein [Muribaculaceae bacterium]
MKNLLVILTVIIGAFSASARNNYSHNQEDLPIAAQTILKNNFKAGVSHIKIEKDFGKIKEYDVILTDGTEVTFDSHGNWKDIEVRQNASVPATLVPKAIADYVNQNQKNAKITGIEKNRSGYEVELSNGVEMKFNSESRFIKYDK